MAPTTDSLLDRAKNAENLSGLAKQGIGGLILAIATAFISGILNLAKIVTIPAGQFASSAGDLINAFFGQALAGTIAAGATATQQALMGIFGLGPFALPFSVAIVLASLYLIAVYREKDLTGNIFPGVPIDVPIIGSDEED
ncbi:MAG: hypothetical protein ABEI77_07555 [Halorientalis sp.]